MPSRAPAPPMYASLGSGPVAALPVSVPPSTLRSWSTGGSRSCVRQETKSPGGARTSGHWASVWQVSEAASIDVSSPGKASSALPRRCSGPYGARPDPVALFSPRPTLSPPRTPHSGLQLAPGFAGPPFSRSGRGSRRPQSSTFPGCCWSFASASGAPFALGGWVVRPSHFSRFPVFLVSTLLLPLKVLNSLPGKIPDSPACGVTKKGLLSKGQ